MLNKFAVIVAGGSGSRMQNETPKQFLLVKNKPILVHTLLKFLEIDLKQIILVLPKQSFGVWEAIKQEFLPNCSQITVVAGGETRFQSVKNGLEAIQGQNGLVAIHDAVRPLVTQTLIEESFKMALNKTSAVAAVHAKDSLRMLNEEKGSQALDRSKIMLIQTPQTFDLALIRSAYNKPEQPWFTDDASVFENFGQRVHLLEGDYKNIKMTTPDDLTFVATYL